MKYKIAIPDNPIFEPITGNFEEVAKKYDVEIYKVEEPRCAELMLDSRVDATLINPKAYADAAVLADYRIVPGHCLALKGYTGAASIYFREGLNTIESSASPTANDFLMQIAALILAERFSIFTTPELKRKSVSELLESYDAVIAYGSGGAGQQALDVSEEWEMAYESILPLAFWVCRSEEFPPMIEDIVKEMALPTTRDQVYRDDHVNLVKYQEERHGSILYNWDSDISNAVEETIKFLFYHQKIDQIGEIKIFGEEESDDSAAPPAGPAPIIPTKPV